MDCEEVIHIPGTPPHDQPTAEQRPLYKPENFTPQSGYVAAKRAAIQTAMNAQSAQLVLQELAEKQQELAEEAEFGPLKEMVTENIAKASRMVEMTVKTVRRLYSDIREQCQDIQKSAIRVIQACDRGQEG